MPFSMTGSYFEYPDRRPALWIDHALKNWHESHRARSFLWKNVAVSCRKFLLKSVCNFHTIDGKSGYGIRAATPSIKRDIRTVTVDQCNFDVSNRMEDFSKRLSKKINVNSLSAGPARQHHVIIAVRLSTGYLPLLHLILPAGSISGFGLPAWTQAGTASVVPRRSGDLGGVPKILSQS